MNESNAMPNGWDDDPDAGSPLRMDAATFEARDRLPKAFGTEGVVAQLNSVIDDMNRRRRARTERWPTTDLTADSAEAYERAVAWSDSDYMGFRLYADDLLDGGVFLAGTDEFSCVIEAAKAFADSVAPLIEFAGRHPVILEQTSIAKHVFVLSAARRISEDLRALGGRDPETVEKLRAIVHGEFPPERLAELVHEQLHPQAPSEASQVAPPESHVVDEWRAADTAVWILSKDVSASGWMLATATPTPSRKAELAAQFVRAFELAVALYRIRHEARDTPSEAGVRELLAGTMARWAKAIEPALKFHRGRELPLEWSVPTVPVAIAYQLYAARPRPIEEAPELVWVELGARSAHSLLKSMKGARRVGDLRKEVESGRFARAMKVAFAQGRGKGPMSWVPKDLEDVYIDSYVAYLRAKFRE